MTDEKPSQFPEPHKVMHEDDPVGTSRYPTKLTRLNIRRWMLIFGTSFAVLILFNQYQIYENGRHTSTQQKATDYAASKAKIAAGKAQKAIDQLNKERKDRADFVNSQLQVLACRLVRLYPDSSSSTIKSLRAQYKCPLYNPNVDLPPKLKTKTSIPGVPLPSGQPGAPRSSDAPRVSTAPGSSSTVVRKVPVPGKTVVKTKTNTVSVPAPSSTCNLISIVGICI